MSEPLTFDERLARVEENQETFLKIIEANGRTVDALTKGLEALTRTQQDLLDCLKMLRQKISP